VRGGRAQSFEGRKQRMMLRNNGWAAVTKHVSEIDVDRQWAQAARTSST